MSSQLLSLDFDTNKTSSYLDTIDPSFAYIDPGLEYLQYPPQSPPAFAGLDLVPTSSPLAFNGNLSLSGAGDYTYSPSFNAGSPERSYTPEEASLSPPMLTYNLSTGEPTADIASAGRHSRNGRTSSPSAASYTSTVPRSHRFNPIGTPNTRATQRAQRKKSKDETDEDDEEFQPIPPAVQNTANPDVRRETIRKQRIESEQRRRDELRDGYSRLKETLPPSNQKSSKVSLLDRATGHIKYLETIKEGLELRLKAAEAEVHRLRNVNEALMLGTASQRHAVGSSHGSQY